MKKTEELEELHDLINLIIDEISVISRSQEQILWEVQKGLAAKDFMQNNRKKLERRGFCNELKELGKINRSIAQKKRRYENNKSLALH